jgi:hypothetical protein
MTKLQQIVKKAQQLRKQYPTKYSKWTDYIKAASKQVAGFEGVSRQGNKTQVHYSRAAPAAKKKAAPAKKKAAPVAKKKAAPAAKKKAAPAAKKKAAPAYQKSLFGVNNKNISTSKQVSNDIEILIFRIEQNTANIEQLMQDIKESNSASFIKLAKLAIIQARKNISVYRKNIKQLKTLI